MNITDMRGQNAIQSTPSMDVTWLLLSDMHTSIYDVVSPSHHINITSTLERSDTMLFYLLGKLDSLLFAKAGPVLKKS